MTSWNPAALLRPLVVVASALLWAGAVAARLVGNEWAPVLALSGGTASVMAWVFPAVGPWIRLVPVTAAGLVAFGLAGMATGGMQAAWFVVAGLAAVPVARGVRRLGRFLEARAEASRAIAARPAPLAVPGRGQRPLSVRGRVWLDLVYPVAHVLWAVAATVAAGLLLVRGVWAAAVPVALLGTVAWGGVAFVFAPLRAGLRWSPRCRWHLDVAGDELRIFTRRHETRVDLARVRAAVHVVDGGWDGLAGLEEECLLLRLDGWLPLIVPGSSTGFDRLRPALEGRGLRIAEREFA